MNCESMSVTYIKMSSVLLQQNTSQAFRQTCCRNANSCDSPISSAEASSTSATWVKIKLLIQHQGPVFHCDQMVCLGLGLDVN